MAASDDLHDRIVRHAISLQRYGNGVVGRLIAILNKADAELFAALFEALENMPGTFKAARLEELLASVRAINEAAYNRIGRELKDELRAFVAAETEFQSQLLIRAAPVNVSFAAVSAEQVFTAAYAQPFRISKDGAVPMAQYLSGLSSARAKLVRDAVSLGWLEGQTIDQVVRRIRGTKAKGFEDGLMEAPRRHVEGMVRTAINHMSNTTSQRVWKANDDLVKGWRFVATLDSRTSMRCASLDQSVHPVGKGPIPPLHINCLPGNSLVSARSGITGCSKRWFDGDLVVLRTASGRELACTPNHPILALGGWIAAQALKLGDEVICDGGSEWATGVDGNNKNMPASIHDVAEAFFRHRNVRSMPVPVSAPDFHGDGVNSDVAVVGAYGPLRNTADAAISQHLDQNVLVLGGAVAAGGISPRASALLIGGMLSAANGIMGRLGKLKALISAQARHSGELLFASVSRWNTGLDKGALNNVGGDAELLRNAGYSNAAVEKTDCLVNVKVDGVRSHHGPAISEVAVNDAGADAVLADKIRNGGSGFVFRDKIVSIKRKNFSGHVYNLETVEGWFSAAGIITHNCRSISLPVLKSWREMGIDVDDFKPGTRASAGGQVAADMSYSDWLRSQPVSVQDEVLGSTRGRLFRAGKLEMSAFVNNKGETLTLSELRQRNAALFEKAGV